MVDGRVYLRDLDSSSYPFKYDVTDTEDPTALDDTISITNYFVGLGPVVPCDATLIKVSHQFAEVGNVDGDVVLKTFHSTPVHASNAFQTLTLKHQEGVNAIIMGTPINRKAYSITTGPDTTIDQGWDAGDVVILGLYSANATLGNPSVEGSTTWLFEIKGNATQW